ncbi:hypothetical protein TSUD_182190 [Trifolium subterraneum]|uniref:Reverse transcriptase zinc-binding domain-containing protein n=1 Tax=Trifolium subterraneum TaxID=3900 RepID=A0A2Z6LPA0_TRISU|nr:hypothetical protein TSUD_182190 [Trifolium subterraneum]
MLVGVNIPDSWLCEVASSLCCRVGKIPFVYLGLPIGGDPRRLSFWEPLLARLKNRLSGWKCRFLSFGGRLILLKSVLTSLPVYALSFFKAPSGKWCWRMLVDREGLWFRVLAARYGVERGSLRAGGRRGSSWWREIASIRDGGGGIGVGWFREHVVKKVGDGDQIDFGGRDVCSRVGSGRRGAGVEASVEVVRGGDVEGDSVTLDAAEDLIWHGQVPLKVSVLAWRLLRDMLPTKSNLVARGILSSEAHHCVSGCGAVESSQHLFLSCSTFGSLWQFSSASLLHAGRLASLCAGCVDREKSQIVPSLIKFFISHVGQDQNFLL